MGWDENGEETEREREDEREGGDARKRKREIPPRLRLLDVWLATFEHANEELHLALTKPCSTEKSWQK